MPNDPKKPVLALDLGTKTGWALWSEPTGRVSGTWKLTQKRTDVCVKPFGGDARVARLFWLVLGITRSRHFAGGTVFYEDVQFSLYTLQTQLWSSFRTAVQFAAAFGGCFSVYGVPVGTLKKAGAGHGAATKDMMASALKRKYPGLEPADDNEVDAVHLLDYALSA